MTTRFRQKQDWYGGYRINRSDGKIAWQQAKSVDDQTTDVVHQGDNQALTVSHKRKSGGMLTGITGNVIIGFDWRGYVATWQAIDTAALSHVTVTVPSNSTMALDVIKRTNPNNAAADLGQDLAELREIPSLLRDSFKGMLDAAPKLWRSKLARFANRVALINILYGFGYAPLIDDLKKTLEFPENVARRIKELERLMSKKGLRRTVRLFSDSKLSTFSAVLESSGVFISIPVTKSTRVSITGHIRWHPYPILIRGDHSILDDAIKTVNGNTIDLVTLYNVIPWTWLIDYFTNLGDFVALNRNTVQCYHDPVRIITRVYTETISGAWSGSGAKMTPIKNSYEQITRVVATPQLEARMTFLTERQTSIIGSLAVLKGPSIWPDFHRYFPAEKLVGKKGFLGHIIY